jgi:hypothetical protein
VLPVLPSAAARSRASAEEELQDHSNKYFCAATRNIRAKRVKVVYLRFGLDNRGVRAQFPTGARAYFLTLTCFISVKTKTPVDSVHTVGVYNGFVDNIQHSLLLMCRDASVGIAMGYRLDGRRVVVRFPARKEIFLFSTVFTHVMKPTKHPT